MDWGWYNVEDFVRVSVLKVVFDSVSVGLFEVLFFCFVSIGVCVGVGWGGEKGLVLEDGGLLFPVVGRLVIEPVKGVGGGLGFDD